MNFYRVNYKLMWCNYERELVMIFYNSFAIFCGEQIYVCKLCQFMINIMNFCCVITKRDTIYIILKMFIVPFLFATANKKRI